MELLRIRSSLLPQVVLIIKTCSGHGSKMPSRHGLSDRTCVRSMCSSCSHSQQKFLRAWRSTGAQPHCPAGRLAVTSDAYDMIWHDFSLGNKSCSSCNQASVMVLVLCVFASEHHDCLHILNKNVKQDTPVAKIKATGFNAKISVQQPHSHALPDNDQKLCKNPHSDAVPLLYSVS